MGQSEAPPVSAKRGVALFEAICGDTLPNFSKSVSVAKVNSVSIKAKTETYYSTKENLSFRLVEGPGAGKTCSIVFQSNSSKRAFMSEASKIASEGKIVKSSLGSGGLYQGAVLFLVDGPIRSEGKKYYSMKMLSQR